MAGHENRVYVCEKVVCNVCTRLFLKISSFFTLVGVEKAINISVRDNNVACEPAHFYNVGRITVEHNHKNRHVGSFSLKTTIQLFFQRCRGVE